MTCVNNIKKKKKNTFEYDILVSVTRLGYGIIQ